MSKHSGKISSAGLMKQEEGMFRCPICFGPMRMADLKSLLCINDHCFDLSKRGYVNLLSRPSKTKYDKRMFASRRIMCRSGFFAPLHAVISDKMSHRFQDQSERIRVLDAGCGEGSHLAAIQRTVMQNTTNPLLAVGMDISKEAIQSAAREYPDAMWCVADIANCPFADYQFRFVLNILSPAHYAEFQRLVADDGMLIKVIPARYHLQELREMLYAGTHRQVYSNDDTLEHFKAKFTLVDVEQVQYRFPLDQTLLEPLLHMTPLSWGMEQGRLQRALKMEPKEITVDLTVLFGRK
ncbi:methyltransferase domain-containing protein [Brevibacillus humidisoli]|uniref:putative RNA methyltransferase n=1 Tax=Brevibacillus humidisoli TaxID=2895522 RepID=UPI001E396DBA|nr:methyltransferase domain-containing protein [Brevibacillus humidisoli]UFJ40911.1 methyltransferase domain-containing protein [Brevibacillus humidisoli]